MSEMQDERRTTKMNIGKARALFEQVASGEYHGSTVGEYLEAVKIVLEMETHNSISKKMIISVCKWLVEIAKKAVSPYRWIPCSEKMPEEHEWIGTKKFGTTISDEVYVTFENEKGERFCQHMKFQNGPGRLFQRQARSVDRDAFPGNGIGKDLRAFQTQFPAA